MIDSIRRRLLDRPWTWLWVGLLAVVAVVLGLAWVGDLQMRTAGREAWAQRIVVAGALGLFVVEAARRLHTWLGVAAAVGLVAFVVVGLGVVVDEIRLDTFDESDRRPTATGPPQVASVEEAPPPAGVVDRAAWDGLRLELEPVITGLEQPMAVEAIPGTDEYFVLQREGEIRRAAEGADGGTTLVDLGDETTLDGERGAYDLALGPVDGRLYVSFSDPEGDNRVISFAVGDDGGLTDRREVIEIIQPFETHNGGALEFDAEGYLLTAVGDGGRLRDPLGSGQDLTTRLSTVLRIAPLAGGGYEIPPDNPFVDVEGVWPEIYAFGLRNPWRMSTDPVTGAIWIGDVGQDSFEEVDVIAFGSPGNNFGWSIAEGVGAHVGKPTAPTGFTEADIPSDHVEPVFFYAHDPEGVEGARNSITGGYVYRGDAIPGLAGTYVYGDFSASIVGGVLIDDTTAIADRVFLEEVPAVVSLGLDHDGELLVVSLGGEISRIVEVNR